MVIINQPHKPSDTIPQFAGALADAANSLPPTKARTRELAINNMMADVREVPFHERDGGHTIPAAIGDIITARTITVSQVPTNSVHVPISFK